VPGAFVNVFSQDATKKSAQSFFSYGMDRGFLQSYFEKYMQLNPLFPAMLFFEEGRILTEEDVMPMSEFRKTVFFKEWVEPQGLIASMASVLEKSAISLAGIAVGRSGEQGPIDESSRQRMEGIIPHVRRALKIGKVIDTYRAEATALADVLDGLTAGMFMVDATGRIVHANTMALSMLSEGFVVQTVGGKLSTVDAPQGDTLLAEVLPKERTGKAPQFTGATIPLMSSTGDRYVAHVLPLTTRSRRRSGMPYSAVAAIFISQAKFSQEHPLEALARAYKLTPTEMRVLTTIVNVAGIREVAPILGISPTTVKTHLSRIFAKTGVNRQVDLAKLMASYASPVC